MTRGTATHRPAMTATADAAAASILIRCGVKGLERFTVSATSRSSSSNESSSLSSKCSMADGPASTGVPEACPGREASWPRMLEGRRGRPGSSSGRGSSNGGRTSVASVSSGIGETSDGGSAEAPASGTSASAGSERDSTGGSASAGSPSSGVSPTARPSFSISADWAERWASFHASQRSPPPDN